VRRALLLAAAVALLAAGGVMGALAFAPRAEPTAAERVQSLSAQLRCPDCQSLSVAESHTQAAAAIRTEVERQVAAGRSDDQIRSYFVDSYGEWILLAPSDPVVWWPPVAALLLGVGVLAAWFRAGRSRARPVPVTSRVGEPERRRIREELEALDG
jgi:cytochrome c-type biogenesis protein CcmH